MLVDSLTAAPAQRSDAGASWLARVGQAFGRSLRVHALFIALILVYLVAGIVIPPLLGVTAPFSPGLYSILLLQVTAAFLTLLAAGYVGHVMIVIRPQQLTRYLLHDIVNRQVTIERVAQALPVFLLFPLFTSTFTFVKAAIPVMHPFAWDVEFAAWDRLLHGGHEPWELLQPLFGHPYATTVLNFFYHLWFFVAYGVLLWQMLALARPKLRMRYLLTMLLLWALLGNVAAVLLSSAGPVYFGRVTGLADPFAPLMAYLHQANAVAPVMALEVQDMLWQSYVERGAGIGDGISAMPSLHVATTFSFALLGFAINRRLGLVFALFSAIILIGSVHLGWHYAIDGYVAIIATWIVWRLVGWLLDRPAVAQLLWGATPPAR
jgi:hypothetical protein